MKKIIKTISTILFVISLYRCGETHDILYIVNNANHTIGFYLGLGGWTSYPDTLLPKTDFPVAKNIKPDKRFSVAMDFEWEKILSGLPKDTMSVFIFHTDTLNKYTWNEVRDRYMILKRYDLSYDDLVRLHDKYKYGSPEIPYPPDERMKDMKMYPPYGSE